MLLFCGGSESNTAIKMALHKRSASGNCNPREGQLPFRPNPNGVRDNTAILRWLLIGADLIRFCVEKKQIVLRRPQRAFLMFSPCLPLKSDFMQLCGHH